MTESDLDLLEDATPEEELEGLFNLSVSTAVLIDKLVDYSKSLVITDSKGAKVIKEVIKMSLDYQKMKSSDPMIMAILINKMSTEEKMLLHKQIDAKNQAMK